MSVNFYRRQFLNKPRYHAGAHVIAEVQNKSRRDKKTKKLLRSIDAELTISDCSRVTTLDFSVYEHGFDRDLKNVLYKAHTLLHAVTDFVAAIEEAVEEIEDAD